MSPQYTKITYYYISNPSSAPPLSQKSNHKQLTMAPAPRQVDFAPIPATYSRLPHDDELYVMKAFTRHASHCSTCAHPYDVHRNGGSLCSKGRQRALDVAQYVFNKAGQTFSVVDLEGNRRIQMEIPADCAVVRELLKAMERGLRLRRKVPVTSFDETYHVPPRVIQPTFEHRRPQEGQDNRKPLLETTLRPSSRREKHSHSGRGSLYEADMKERDRRLKRSYYRAGSGGVLPVLAKDVGYNY